ncbi:hypothetical protein DFJ77DRAFT_455785 [Powellomyces hirtus]|nr:hypothetical protein DFJ77DRAFT_455785 [Powellomyces hirtus]
MTYGMASSHTLAQAVTTEILRAHGLFDAFLNTSPDRIWSIEIRPKEGATTGFSLPLIIAREGSMVRLASYTVSTYDVDYDPVLEFEVISINPAATIAVPALTSWRIASLYRFHTGTCVFAETDDRTEADAFAAQWCEVLLERGYSDVSQGEIVWLSGGGDGQDVRARL